eukprot:TRINITY_DN25628_c0_g1_i1.p1 TRINITY_DN25628_c0_g1~~TRINITY_DN25628_c0_g1_i1.p1  ORF type:complete len:313 (-),score=43.42 TRINITY_DN25628_c0_g1_i1:82-963(-)
MSKSAKPPQLRLLRIKAAECGSDFEVALYDGVSADALMQVVAARVGAPVGSVFLTSTPDYSGPVIPLSAALPEGLELTVHRFRQPDAAFSPRQRVRRDPDNGDAKQRLISEVQRAASGHVTLGGEQPLDVPLLDPESRPAAGSADPQQEGSISMTARSRQHSVESLAAQQADQFVTAMERFQRLSTDLANERTLLAWIRTNMAAIRTVFSFYAMTGVSKFWDFSLITSETMMATLVIVLAVTGHTRYYRIKDAIMLREPPATFGRTSLRYTYVVLVVASVTTALGIILRRWQH